MRAMITHVKFVSIPTTDQDRALAFYTERLGFKVVTDQPFGPQRWIELRVGTSDTRFVLFTMDDGPLPGSRFPGALECDNVQKTYDALVAKGVAFLSPPKQEPWGTFAVMQDPDGNTFVLSSR
jgi:predicted enzyme related to lactoylglutathione lyase